MGWYIHLSTPQIIYKHRAQAKQVSDEINNNFKKPPFVIVLSLQNFLGNLGKTHLDSQLSLARVRRSERAG